ncbi:MAG: SAM-dependent chlorinase/fluorinase [bacterium]|nr:SAM-dependent chlorinase/fluorinase [bacterium]
MRNITLLTDFGIRDGFVASVKGVITSINADVRIIDITHSIPPQDINSAMFVLLSTYKYFPESTIHVVIVDPGVGSDRKIICVDTPRYTFLAPDNGVLSWVLLEEKDYSVFEINDPQLFLPEVSNSFHGRDIFAPIAARLSLGESPLSLGTRYYNPKIEPFPEVNLINGEYFEATIIYIDNFGNLITNIENKFFQQISGIYKSSGELLDIIPGSHYSEVPEEKALFFPGSSGFLEIGVNLNSAEKRFAISKREVLLFKRKD